MKVAAEGFFNNLAEDSDIIKSGPDRFFAIFFGGALTRADLISGVIPLIILSLRLPRWVQI
jgi:putative N-acetylmannosamine-6-phosphate epimerase